jgi:hypothetical protein
MNQSGEWVRDPRLRISGVWNLVPTVPSLNGCNTVDHTYLATLTPNATDAVSFAISDDNLKDNSGSLDVVIRRVLALPDLGLGGGGGGRWN